MLACLARRTYKLHGSRLSLADVQAPLTTNMAARGDARSGAFYLGDDGDILAQKPATDIVVSGSAHSAKPVAELMIAVAAGASVRRLRVVGPRVADVAPDGTVSFSDPAPFEETELSPLLAYGGGDLHAQNLLERLADGHLLGELPADERPARASWVYSYMRNPVGLAYFIDVDRRRAAGAFLPRIEDRPIRSRRALLPAHRTSLAVGAGPGAARLARPRLVSALRPRPRRGAVARSAAPPRARGGAASEADLLEIRKHPQLQFHPQASRARPRAPRARAPARRRDGPAREPAPRRASVHFQLPGEVPVFRATRARPQELSPTPRAPGRAHRRRARPGLP